MPTSDVFWLRYKSYWNYNSFRDCYHSLSGDEHAWNEAKPPWERCMQIRCVMKDDSRGALPARHALSDRRINSSLGNNIFIFQGQRFSFFPSSSRAAAVSSPGKLSLFWLWNTERANEQRGNMELHSTSKTFRRSRLELVENRWAINNAFNQISWAKSSAGGATRSWYWGYLVCIFCSYTKSHEQVRGEEKTTRFAAKDEHSFHPKAMLSFPLKLLVEHIYSRKMCDVFSVHIREYLEMQKDRLNSDWYHPSDCWENNFLES